MIGSKAGNGMEQLRKKTRELEVVAAMCKVNAEKALEDIAVSMETTNKLTKSLHSRDETREPYLLWWSTFLQEWSHQCRRMWLDRYGDLKDYQRMQNSWFVFEILWVTGCDMVRVTRLNDLRGDISKVIAGESPSESDVEEIWQWHEENMRHLDEAVLKIINLFKEKQRQAIIQALKELKEYDEASLLGKLKRLLSS